MKLDKYTYLLTGFGGTTADNIVAELVRSGARVVDARLGDTTTLNEVSPGHFRLAGKFEKNQNVTEAWQQILAKVGRIDGLINLNNGISVPADEPADSVAWQDRISASFSATLNWCQTLLPHLREGSSVGHIINIDSQPDETDVRAAIERGALHSLTGSINRDSAPGGLRAHSIFFGDIAEATLINTVIGILSGATDTDLTLLSEPSAPEAQDSPASEPEERPATVENKNNDDLMSTLGFSQEDGSQPEQPEEGDKSPEAELKDFNIDKSGDELPSEPSPTPAPEGDKAPDSEQEESPPEPQPAKGQKPDKDKDIPSDSSYLLDSDFSDFTVDEKVISNYRLSLAELKKLEAEEKAAQEAAGEPAADKTPASAGVDPAVPGFYLVDLYLNQGFPKRAAALLETLSGLDVPPEKLAAKKQEVAEALGESLEDEATPQEPEVHQEEPQAHEPPPDTKEPSVAAQVDRPEPTPVPEPEPEPKETAPTAEPVEDDYEQQRIKALERRMGRSESETAPAAAADEAEETTEQKPDDSAPELSLVDEYVEQQPVPGRLTKWLAITAAVIVGLAAVYIFWPSEEDTPVTVDKVVVDQPPPTPTAEAVIEEAVAVIDTAAEEITPEPEPPVEEEVVAPVEEKPVPAPPKPRPQVKTLPLRNLSVNRQAWDHFERGDYHKAAEIWGREKKAKPDNYTILMLFGCEESTILNAYRNLDKPADFFVLPRALNNRACYSICWGDFASREDARQWFDEIPAWFYDNQAKPLISSFGRIKITRPTVTPVRPPKPEPEAARPQEEAVIQVADSKPAKSTPSPVQENSADTTTDRAVDTTDANDVSVAEEAFISAMLTLPADDQSSDAESDPASAIEQSGETAPADTVVVLTSGTVTDDWIEMDTATAALEPETQTATEIYVDIASLEEEETTVPEPKPDYSPAELLNLGHYVQAAGLWEIQKKAGANGYTIRLMVACQDISVADAYSAVNRSSSFFLLPRTLDDQDCYTVCLGDFNSKRAAKKALKEVPPWFERNGDKPQVVRLSDLSR